MPGQRTKRRQSASHYNKNRYGWKETEELLPGQKNYHLPTEQATSIQERPLQVISWQGLCGGVFESGGEGIRILDV